LLDARLAHKAGKGNPNQQSFSFKIVPPPLLRAVHVTTKEAVRKMGIRAVANFRVPPSPLFIGFSINSSTAQAD